METIDEQPQATAPKVPDHVYEKMCLAVYTSRSGAKAARLPDGTKIEVPLDIVISLLRPDELEKLQKYIASYLGKPWRQ